MITHYCEAKHVVPTYSPRARTWLSPRELREKARAETDRLTRSALDPVEGAAAAPPRAARSCQPRACNAICTRQHPDRSLAAFVPPLLGPGYYGDGQATILP
jgi:hypothetical protein